MRVYVEAYGCAQNQGEAHALERAVVEARHQLVEDPARAEVGVLVTCGVIGSTEARMVRRWQYLAHLLPRVVVTGCLVPLRTGLLTGPGLDRTSLLPIREQERLPALLEEWSRDPTSSAARPFSPDPTPPSPSSPPVAEVVIAQGCTSRCSYCFSRLARGRLESVPFEEILRRVQRAAAAGAVEIRLTSLDTACWGMDRLDGRRLPDLLRGVAAIPGSFRIRVGMMSPQSLQPALAGTLEALGGPRFYRFLHLPVQSGSDSVLTAMARGYDVETFRAEVATARERLPDVMLSTDLIVGFPGETDHDFQQTLALVDQVAPDIVNVTRYSSRPGTPASRRSGVLARVSKQRSRELTQLRMRVARRRMERWIGTTAAAWVVEAGRDGTSVARLPNYLPVVLPRRYPVGQLVRARIDGARSNYLMGGVEAEDDGAGEHGVPAV